jgi:NAD(P)H-flavin reductase
MLPVPHRVVERRVETHDAVTLHLEPMSARLPPFRPGQFGMLYAHGIGEVPISVSGPPDPGNALVHTVRDVGAVSRALHRAQPGTVVGVRGPFGTCWDADGDNAAGTDLLMVAGGIGLAPLRPMVLAALDRPDHYRRVVLVAGARTPADLLYGDEVATWTEHGVQVELTVDRPAPGWTGQVGFVTEPLARIPLDPDRITALLCGPEPMMQFAATVLERRGVAPARIRVSLERDMKCGIGVCGHCQLGPLLLCRDGPVVGYATAAPLLTVREL